MKIISLLLLSINLNSIKKIFNLNVHSISKDFKIKSTWVNFSIFNTLQTLRIFITHMSQIRLSKLFTFSNPNNIVPKLFEKILFINQLQLLLFFESAMSNNRNELISTDM